MNSPLLAQAAAMMPADRGASPAARDAADQGDLYASWKTIFERAHAVEEPRDEAARRLQSQGTAADRAIRSGGSAFGDVTTKAGFVGSNQRALPGNSISDAPVVSEVVRAARAGATNVSAPGLELPSHSTEAFANASVSASSPVRIAARYSGLATASAACDAFSYIVTASSAVESPDAVMADSVVVCTEGASVSIAVRDAAMSDEQALRTGFETARTLAGRSAALRQLTLNGRTIYQQPVDASLQGPERPDATLLFGC